MCMYYLCPSFRTHVRALELVDSMIDLGNCESTLIGQTVLHGRINV